jgi:hypothetical protein
MLLFVGLLASSLFAFAGRDRATPAPVSEMSVAAFTRAVGQEKVANAVVHDDSGTVTGTLTSGQTFRVQVGTANSNEFRKVFDTLSAAKSVNWRVEGANGITQVLPLLSIAALPLVALAFLAALIVWILRNAAPSGPRQPHPHG